jgi:hypothetical protein
MIRHTQTLGRESGGFAKYLTAQGSSSSIMTPSGQPMSFREDFEKKIQLRACWLMNLPMSGTTTSGS